jgi:hypothetical protein
MIQEILESEHSIEWLEDIEKLDYVREAVVLHRTRAGPIRKGFFRPGKIVGYSKLKKDARSYAGYFHRRVFWLSKGDRTPESPGGAYSPTGAPCEGVDPRTVEAGKSGRLTEKAWGGPLP